MTPIDDRVVLDEAIDRSARGPVVLYKHSTLCGASFRARREMLRLTEPGDPPVYEVVVQHQRDLSRLIETELAVRHESPQVIVLHQGRPTFHTSHSRVTADAVRDAVSRLPAAP